jgi:MoaA/NifB/PqqE/SkfB family radical SAM enzyme
MYPWKQLEFKPNGTVRPCCLYNEPLVDANKKEFNMNNEQSFSVDEIYFSPTMTQLREEFRAGNKPSGCSHCWMEESVGTKSGRLLYNWVLRDELFNIDYESENITNLTSLDLKLGNLCNLSCRICNSYLSSTVATEVLKTIPDATEKKKHPAYIALKQGEWPKRQPAFWREFAKLLPHLTYCQFAGGEPLMTPSHFEVLRQAVDTGNAKNITLRYNTNGTQFPEFVLDLWQEFKLVHLDISIDDIGDRFEYQRNGASWQEVVGNIQRYNTQRRPNFKTQVSTSVSVMNVLYLPELYEWYKSENFDSWWVNFVYTPSSLSISNLTQAAKELVLDRLENYDFGLDQSQIDIAISMVKNGHPVDGSKFASRIRTVDLRRNQDLRSAHKEIAAAMGYMLN